MRKIKTLVNVAYVSFIFMFLCILWNSTTTDDDEEEDVKTPGLLIDTPGCRISDVDPFHPLLKGFYKKLAPKKPEKANVFTNLIHLTEDKIILNQTARRKVLRKFKATSVTCCVRYIKNYPVEADAKKIRFPFKCKYFTTYATITDEYMQIKCHVDGTPVYDQFHVKVMRKADVEARCRNILENSKKKSQACEEEDQLSVMIFGIDSLSRLNFHRQLPESRRILLEKLGAIELLGYNKAGEYTFMCLMPFFSGMSHTELEKQCGGGTERPFDDCRFLWDTFGAAGYRTAFVENMNYCGLFTNRNRLGFRRQPADYYGRPFYNVFESKKETNVTKRFRNSSSDEALFQWGLEFHRQFRHDLHFGFFWISMFSHDVLNTAQHIDPFLSKVLRTLQEEDAINRTLLVVMSDHGLRTGAIRRTEFGILEDKLPAAYFVFPEWFQKKHPEAMRNFRRNAGHRMVTAFDIHKTLEDVAFCTMPPPHLDPSVRRGVNLFSAISADRTCADAGIEDIYCACRRKETFLQVNSTISKKVTSIVLEELNRLVAQRRDVCAPLALKEVTRVKLEEEVEGRSPSDAWTTSSSYTVVLSTTPGSGTFEGTVYHDRNKDKFTLHENIRRISRYGKTSHCVRKDPVLLKICYCLKQQSNTKETV